HCPASPVAAGAYPTWARGDRQADAGRLERGAPVIADGNEPPASTVVAAVPDEVVEMPGESPGRLAVALCTALLFVMLLTRHYAVAGIFAAMTLLAVAAWHSQEPQEQ